MSKLYMGTAKQKAKREIDWVQIQSHYRAGLLSVREIAASQGISHTAIQNRAKAYKWERDLNAKVQAKADMLVTRREVANGLASETGGSESLIVDTNAKVIADIRIKHRAYISQMNALATSMMTQLEMETDSPELFMWLGELLIDMAYEDNKEYQAKHVEAINKTLSLNSRIEKAKKLAEVLKILIGLERIAYGIYETPDPNQATNQQNNFVKFNTDWDAFEAKMFRHLK